VSSTDHADVGLSVTTPVKDGAGVDDDAVEVVGESLPVHDDMVGVGEIEGVVGVGESLPVHDDMVEVGESLPVHDETVGVGEIEGIVGVR
jgi:hypothetical protein